VNRIPIMTKRQVEHCWIVKYRKCPMGQNLPHLYAYSRSHGQMIK
jgi:hypothetical protein